MKFSISDLAFAGFKNSALEHLPSEYGIEIFYEFGTDNYWDARCEKFLAERKADLSIHAPCVAVNLADAKDFNYLEVYRRTLAYAQRQKAAFVVLHTNEKWTGDRDAVTMLVEKRLKEILALAKMHHVKVLIENVGLRTNGTLLYDWEQYLELLAKFPQTGALIDLGHAHVNDWNIINVLEVLQSQIKAVHLHDNNGMADQHLPIGEGSIDWQGYFCKAKEVTPEAVQVLEYKEIRLSGLLKHLEMIKTKYNV